MSTKVYGCSDDLIEFEGDVSGEVGYYSADDDGRGALIMCSDGTLLDVLYGKGDRGIWAITLIETGSLFESLQPCTDEDADPPSDIVRFKDGLRWAYAATGKHERVG